MLTSAQGTPRRSLGRLADRLSWTTTHNPLRLAAETECGRPTTVAKISPMVPKQLSMEALSSGLCNNRQLHIGCPDRSDGSGQARGGAAGQRAGLRRCKQPRPVQPGILRKASVFAELLRYCRAREHDQEKHDSV